MQWAWPSIFFRLFRLQRPQRVCKRMKIEKLNWGQKAAVSSSPLGLFWAPCESQDWLALWRCFPRDDSRQGKSTWLNGVERNPASSPLPPKTLSCSAGVRGQGVAWSASVPHCGALVSLGCVVMQWQSWAFSLDYTSRCEEEEDMLTSIWATRIGCSKKL